MTGPIGGMRYIHKAISTELATLEEKAGQLDSRDSGQAAKLAEDYSFLGAVVRGHAGGEDGVLYPALNSKVPQTSVPYEIEHQAEEGIFHQLESMLSELQATSDSGQRAALARQVYRQAVAVNVTLSLHIRKEEEHLIPLTDEHFPAAEQGALLGQMIRHFTQDFMPRVLPWMMKALSADEREDQFRVMSRTMPAPAFAGLAGLVKKALTAEEWAEQVKRLPDLSSVA